MAERWRVGVRIRRNGSHITPANPVCADYPSATTRFMGSLLSGLRMKWDHEPQVFAANASSAATREGFMESLHLRWPMHWDHGTQLAPTTRRRLRFMESLQLRWQMHWDHEPRICGERQFAATRGRFMERENALLPLSAVASWRGPIRKNLQKVVKHPIAH